MEEIKEKLQAIQRRYNENMNSLTNENGERLHTDAKHEQLVSQFQKEALGQLSQVREALDERLDKANQMEMEANAFSEISLLNNSTEMDKAASLRAFVSEDVQTLSWNNLVARVRKMLGSNGKVPHSRKPEAILLYRYLRRRLEEESDDILRSEEEPVRKALSALGEALGDNTVAYREKANEIRRENKLLSSEISAVEKHVRTGADAKEKQAQTHKQVVSSW